MKFKYIKLKYRFICNWKNFWNNGFFIKNNKININEGSSCINYSQQCFEGVKSFFLKKKLNIIHIEKHAFRFQKSCKKIIMPILSIYFFINVIIINNYINRKYIPHLKIGFLYIRPLLLGIGNNIGVKPSKKYIFLVFNIPIKNNYIKNIFCNYCFKKRIINEFGNYKFGSNYILNIQNYFYKIYNFYDYIYINNSFFEELGTANILFFKKKKIFSYKNNSILPGINKFYLNYFFKKNFFLILKKKNSFKKINNFTNFLISGTAIFYINIKGFLYKNKIFNYKNNFLYKYILISFRKILENKFKFKKIFFNY